MSLMKLQIVVAAILVFNLAQSVFANEESSSPSNSGQFANGIDVLERRQFKGLCDDQSKTCRIGVLTNHTGRDQQGRRTIDILASAPGVKLEAIFAPEHSIDGTVDTTKIGNSVDRKTGVTVYSLYGATDAQKRPPMDVLKNLDAVVYDLQDAGASFYTYQTTLGYLLEAARETGTKVIVLDRPNPVNGLQVQGPITDGGSTTPGGSCEGRGSGCKFIDYSPKAIRHGMTMGELAMMFNAQIAEKSENKKGARLEVVQMQGWQRKDWFDATGTKWISPSPNLRSLNATALYSGVAILEFSNVSVGRGTPTPFEVLGAPWINGEELSSYLNNRNVVGVRFEPCQFTPESSRFSGEKLSGVKIILLDREKLDAPALGVEIASALIKNFKNAFEPKEMIALLGNRETYDAIVAGQDPKSIANGWTAGLEKWKSVRSKYLLYP